MRANLTAVLMVACAATLSAQRRCARGQKRTAAGIRPRPIGQTSSSGCASAWPRSPRSGSAPPTTRWSEHRPATRNLTSSGVSCSARSARCAWGCAGKYCDADSTNQGRVAELLDRLIKIQHDRVDIQDHEQQELAGFLTPLQRAKYFALEQQIRQRVTQLRQMQQPGRAGRMGRRIPPGGQGVQPPPPPPVTSRQTTIAGMAELADARDSKSRGANPMSSILSLGIKGPSFEGPLLIS